MQFRKKILTLFLGFCFYAAYGSVLVSMMPDVIVSIEGEDISKRPFSPEIKNNSLAVSEITLPGKQFATLQEGSISLCGIIPIKSVRVQTISAKEVIPGGNVVGIKLYTKGAVVVSTDSFTEGLREYSPGLKSGIKPGDVIVAVNGEEVVSAQELSQKVTSGQLTLTVVRGEEKLYIPINPHKTKSGYRLGLWVRDSSAGIGTLTFFRPDTGTYAALGHGLTDSDAGIVLPVSKGDLVSASVISVVPGKPGAPGELCGVFSSPETPIGTLEINSNQGIGGTLTKTDFLGNTLYRLCPRDEIKCGKAHILSCINGTEVKPYEIEIGRVYNGEKGPSKDMLISVTDRELISKTGGIVQGMSGSPIIQNGKLIGAVTHVLVNDPTRGYGIFIENMLVEKEISG